MAKRQAFSPVEEQDKKKVTKEGLRKALRIFNFVWPYKYMFLTGMVFLGLSSLTVMVFPYVTARLVDSAVGVSMQQDRNTLALSIIGILVLQSVFSFLRVLLFSRVSESSLQDIRLALYSKMVTLPVPFMEQRRVGELTSRLTTDVAQLQDVLSLTLAEFFRQLVTLVGGVFFIFFISTRLTLVMLSSFPFIVIGAIIFGKYIRTLSKKSQDQLAEANVVAEETLQAINIVKAFTNEVFEVSRYRKTLDQVLQNALRTAMFRGGFISFIIFAIFGGIVLVMWYGLGLVQDNLITIGDLVAFVMYTVFIGAAVGGMGDMYGQLQKTIGASERILEILEEKSEIDLADNVPNTRVNGSVRFDNVRFSYPSRADVQILKGISFEVEAGKKVALVGHSGAGKSTIVQLLSRYYELESGFISVDDKNIKDYNITELRRNIGVVPQEVMLFGGTIRENIAYGLPEATEAQVQDAARKANAWDFISAFPEGLETIVGERGIKLSGGQRQRIAIARAILKNPAVLVLDEATSSLDAESEKLVQAALDELMKNRTTIIIAHRLATIRQVDTIYVLNEGRIIEQGTHEQLLTNDSGLYANLIKLQFELKA
ncbi:ABC-type multidrug transport system, ATPase and permease component [Flexibacter flexilis DSM 6793]|uniref:ABC-type multidrug transport system, ATPase and permease component n=1 Tax=Flexibacter flexilis DSM 6793 TaxID=927664 RepID=A0A1I1FSK2_9BACT|nr:ABC transporter transmembrane domain-containing protein [Flexibacter flexilis]SFC01986.1 ABC-type multidrug transport system, ATPase and permease component [Flexibacter flexilis DSM 6793]